MRRQRFLYLMRHGLAQQEGYTTDFVRPLTKAGRESIYRQASSLRGISLFRPDCIFCSTALRARQTAEILETVFTGVPIFYRETLYLAPSFRILDMLRETDDLFSRVLIIGHNPGLEHLSALLVPSDNMVALPCGACVLLNLHTPWPLLGTASARQVGYIAP